MGLSRLADAAFGTNPGLWPLPPAHSATGLWLRAVAAGGQGHYAVARADLAELRRGDPPVQLAALALSTWASFHRQLGWHWVAHRWDGEALRVAGPGLGADPESVVDSLLGLAADALGVGRLAVSAALFERAGEVLRRAGNQPPRLAIRLAWVGAELAMAAGNGAAALGHARRGVELAAQASPALQRHRVKSDVVLAAALCSAGDVRGSRFLADAALTDTQTFGLVPLRWALACLLTDIGSAAHTATEIAEIRTRCTGVVTRNGGRWRSG